MEVTDNSVAWMFNERISKFSLCGSEITNHCRGEFLIRRELLNSERWFAGLRSKGFSVAGCRSGRLQEKHMHMGTISAFMRLKVLTELTVA
jgi:hypothetical protein